VAPTTYFKESLMATVEHRLLTTGELHEPKGIGTAPAGYHYRSNGSGGGAWEKIQGWGQYQDSRTTVGTPALTIATGARTKFVNNGGALTLEYLPSDATSALWNTTTNKHTPIAVNDVYDLRISFKAQNYAGTDPYLTCELDIGGGPGVIFDQLIPLVKGGAVQAASFAFPVYTSSTYISNGGEIYLTYTGTGSCDIFSTAILIHRQSRIL
jgi:hypothetical protein